MEKLDDLYLEFVPINYLDADSLVDVQNCLASCVEYIDSDIKDMKKEIKKNKFLKNVSKFMDKSVFFKSEYSEEFYILINEILENAIKVSDRFSTYFSKLFSLVDEDNYEEVYKLACFIVQYQSEYVDYVMYKSDVIKYILKGIDYSDINKKEHTEELDNFFEGQYKLLKK